MATKKLKKVVDTEKLAKNTEVFKTTVYAHARMHGRNVEFTTLPDGGLTFQILPGAVGPIEVPIADLEQDGPDDLAQIVLREAGL